jgi:hypothetical protein
MLDQRFSGFQPPREQAFCLQMLERWEQAEQAEQAFAEAG